MYSMAGWLTNRL